VVLKKGGGECHTAVEETGYLQDLTPGQWLFVQYIGEGDTAGWSYGLTESGQDEGWFPSHVLEKAPEKDFCKTTVAPDGFANTSVESFPSHVLEKAPEKDFCKPSVAPDGFANTSVESSTAQELNFCKSSVAPDGFANTSVQSSRAPDLEDSSG